MDAANAVGLGTPEALAPVAFAWFRVDVDADGLVGSNAETARGLALARAWDIDDDAAAAAVNLAAQQRPHRVAVPPQCSFAQFVVCAASSPEQKKKKVPAVEVAVAVAAAVVEEAAPPPTPPRPDTPPPPAASSPGATAPPPAEALNPVNDGDGAGAQRWAHLKGAVIDEEENDEKDPWGALADDSWGAMLNFLSL